MSTDSSLYTVSRLNACVRQLLENELGTVWLIGEVSNFSAPISGHWYFTLKDVAAQVKCAMFKGNNRLVRFTPQAGQQVLVKARLSLYEPRGDYQLIIESMQPEGNGRLQQAFEQLKIQLAAEGLFAQARKQSLPQHPQTIGIITSQTGAALHDILHVLARRDPSLQVIIYPTLVQGEDAPEHIIHALNLANRRQECDVIILGRGGGSLEDLNGFNDEGVARAIAASQIPVISAVGHEVDVTIADFVADVRAATPSAAAELVSQDHQQKHEKLKNILLALQHAIQYRLNQQTRQLEQLQYQLDKHYPIYRLERQQQVLDEHLLHLIRAVELKLFTARHQLEQSQQGLMAASPAHQLKVQQQNLVHQQDKLLKAMTHQQLVLKHQWQRWVDKLNSVSPLATLSRGYSITRTQDGRLVTDAHQLSVSDQLTTQLADGVVHSRVISVE